MKHNIFLFTSVFVLCLIGSEIVLRIFVPRKTIDIGTTETTKADLYGWARIPNSKIIFRDPDTAEKMEDRINSQGWKDVDHSLDKPDGTMRILFIGDSYTYGLVPLKHLYTRKVEQKLKDQGIPNIEVISIGLSAWGTDQALEVLRNEGVKYVPDIVIYQFCVNDLSDNLQPKSGLHEYSIYQNKPFRYELNEGQLQRIELLTKTKRKEMSTKYQLRKFLLKSELIYYTNLLKRKLLKSLKSFLSRNNEDNDSLNKGEMPPNLNEPSEIIKLKRRSNLLWGFQLDPTSSDFVYNMNTEFPYGQKEWALLKALLVEMKNESQKHNAQFVVFSESGDNGRRKWYLKSNIVQTDGISDFITWQGHKYPVDLKRPLKNLSKLTQLLNIPLIKPKRDYTRFENDIHSNREGNEKMAQDIVDFLMKWDYFIDLKKNEIKTMQ